MPAEKRVTTRRLLRLAVPHRGTLLVATLCLVVASLASLAYPSAIRYLVDVALVNGDVRVLNQVALAMVAVVLIQAVAGGFRFLLFTRTGERIVADLRKRVFGALLDQEIAYFDAHKTGALVSHLTSDAGVLQNAVSVNISMALRNLVTAVLGIGFLFFTSWKLTLVMLLVVPPTAIFGALFARRTRKLSREAQDKIAEGAQVAEESLSQVRTVHTFMGQKREAVRYGAATQASLNVAEARIRLSSVFIGTTSFLGFAAASTVLWYGGHLVIQGQMTGGALTSFLLYTVTVAFSLGAMTDLYADFSRAEGAAERIFEILDRKPELQPGAQTLPDVLPSSVAALRFDAVTFRYPQRPETLAIDGVSFELGQGERVAVVGASGAGKSTLAALALRLYDPEQGTIELFGQNVRTLTLEAHRQQISIVSQEPALFGTTIAENILYGNPTATQAQIESAASAANAHEFIAKFPQGYQTVVGERGTQLSGGQKQRVAIARAILRGSPVLILDEATSALDSESEHQVQVALDVLMQGRSTLVIAHRLSTVESADRVLVMEHGRVVQSGTHKSLLATDGVYSRLVARQLQARA